MATKLILIGSALAGGLVAASTGDCGNSSHEGMTVFHRLCLLQQSDCNHTMCTLQRSPDSNVFRRKRARRPSSAHGFVQRWAGRTPTDSEFVICCEGELNGSWAMG